MRWLSSFLLALVLCGGASAQWSYPTTPPLQLQINGTTQGGVTTINFPAGSVAGGVLSPTAGAAASSPFAIGTNLVLSATGLTAPRTFTFPDATDVVDVLGTAQSFGAVKTFSAAPVFGAGATASGSGAFDLSGSTGAFKFPSGGITNTPAFAAGWTASGSTAFDLSGSTGAFKFPSGGITNTPAFAAGWTASGSTAFDLSGSSGTFKFPTGGVAATVALSGFTAAANSNAYDLSAGSGAFKFPSGGITNTPAFAAGWTASGSTAFDLSGSSGAFKFPTGGVAASVALSGFTAAANSNNYDLSGGSGTFKFPTGGVAAAFSVASSNYIAVPILRPGKNNVADANSSDTNHMIQAWTSISAARLWNGTCAIGSTSNPYTYIFVDESGSASGTNTITIQPSSGTINGSASKVCINSANGFCRMYSNGTNCFLW